MRKLLTAALILAFCTAGSAMAKTIRVGVTPGPHAQIMEKVKEVAAAKGLEIDIQEFSDYVIPNMALADGATVAIPNDPTNGARALLVLADNGLIKIDPAKGLRASVIDVTENPKNLKFVELDAAQLPRSLEDVEAAVINTNYAMEAGLNPAKDPLIREGEKAPYFNIIAVRTADKDADWVKELVSAYHSPEVKAFIEETFKGSVQPSW
jgi:D-methionine transport system substrate-binding protein